MQEDENIIPKPPLLRFFCACAPVLLLEGHEHTEYGGTVWVTTLVLF